MLSLQRRCQQPKKELLRGESFRFIDNGSNVLAVAHCDSVTCGLYRFKQRGDLVYSTSLDDRLGVHVILDVLPPLGIRPDVLLTDDEEIGRSTAQEFFTDKQYNWMFQFDRRGTDAVCYEYENMEPYVEECFKLGWGTFSDICWLDHLGCGGVNVGTGYYNEHTKNSYANLSHCTAQVGRFAAFWDAFKDEFIPHEPRPYLTEPKADLGFYTDDGEEWKEYFHYSPSPPYGTMKKGKA